MNVIQVKLHGKTSPRWRPVTYMVLSDFNERTTALQEKLNTRSSRYYYHLQNHIQIWFIAMLEWSRRFLTNCEGIYLSNVTKKSWRIIVLFYSWRITRECFFSLDIYKCKITSQFPITDYIINYTVCSQYSACDLREDSIPSEAW